MYIIDKSTEDQQVFSRRTPFAALRELLTDAEVKTICKQLGHTWRERKLPPAIMVRSLVYRSLHRNLCLPTWLRQTSNIGRLRMLLGVRQDQSYHKPFGRN